MLLFRFITKIVTCSLCMQGRFYFGELLQDSTGCDEDVSAVFMISYYILY